MVGDDGAGRSLIRAVDVRVRRTDPGQRLASWLAGAGVKLVPTELIGILVATSLVAFFILSNLVSPVFAFVVAVGASISVARTIVERRRGNRRDAFVAQLPDVARDALQRHLRRALDAAGRALASRELADPAATELQADRGGDAGSGAARGLARARCANGCRRARSRC